MYYIKNKNTNFSENAENVSFSQQEIDFLNNFSTLEDVINFCEVQQANFTSLLKRLEWIATNGGADMDRVAEELARRSKSRIERARSNTRLLEQAKERGLISTKREAPYGKTIVTKARNPEMEAAAEDLRQKARMDARIGRDLDIQSRILPQNVEEVALEDLINAGGVGRPTLSVAEFVERFNPKKQGK